MEAQSNLCREIDKTIETKSDNPQLFAVVVDIISNEESLPVKLVEMAYEIHETDSYTAETKEVAEKYNFLTFDKFLTFLEELKAKNIELWEVDNN
jgi:hypothetical protein